MNNGQPKTGKNITVAIVSGNSTRQVPHNLAIKSTRVKACSFEFDVLRGGRYELLIDYEDNHRAVKPVFQPTPNMRYHSVYVGLDGEDYFVTLYLQGPNDSDPVYPFNVADNLTQSGAESLSRALEAAGNTLLPLIEHLTNK